MKGVSDVIAVLILLLIAISLTVTFYYFATNILTGQMQGIEVRDIFCSGNVVSMDIKNMGINNVTLITCTRTSPTSTPACTLSGTYPIEPGQTNRFTETCPNTGQRVCSYRLLASSGGKAATISITCT